REGLAKLSGQVGAARSRVEAAEAELGRLRESVVEVAERRRRAQSEFTALESQVAGAEEGEEGLDADYEEAGAALDAVLERLEDLKAQERSAERERGALQARVEALRLGLERKDGSRTLLAAGMDGVLGPVAGLLTVEPGYEAAIAAALGSLSEGVAVESLGAAGAALQRMKDDDAGRVELLVAVPAG
ncbi:chromosome segregation protein SMC, partial [Arthrobacter sp. EH-1B-1]|nr:chromosome segregation protein SMC [Arthrobacter vasquezii]